MAFTTKYMTFAVLEEKPNDGKCIETVPDKCIAELLTGIDTIFQKCRSTGVNIITTTIISDRKFLHPGDIKKIADHIRKLGGTVEHSFGPALRIKTQEGCFITMYQVGGSNPIAAEMVYPKHSLADRVQAEWDEAMAADDDDMPEIMNLPADKPFG